MRFALLALVSCGWLPPDSPPQKPAPPDPIAHDWTIENHVLAANATMNDADARERHGRKIAITATGYRAPFQGTCDEATRTQQTRGIIELVLELELSREARATIERFGIGKQPIEYTLACTNGRTPPLVLYVTGDRAMTCFAGACFLLTWRG